MKHLIARFQRLGCLHVFLLAISLQMGTATALAQNGTPSHRRLGLPSNSPDAPQQQLARLLQYFRALKGPQQKPSPENSVGDLPSAEELRKSASPGVKKLLDQLPPGALDRVMKDPNSRRQIKEMLNQFRETGVIPEFSSLSTPGTSSGSPSPPDPNGPPQRPTGQDDQNPDRSHAQPRSPNFKPNAEQPNSESRENPKDRLKELMEELRSSQATNGLRQAKDLQNNPKEETAEQRDKRRREMSPGKLSNSEIDERIRELLQKQRESNRRSTDDGPVPKRLPDFNDSADRRQPADSPREGNTDDGQTRGTQTGDVRKDSERTDSKRTGNERTGNERASNPAQDHPSTGPMTGRQKPKFDDELKSAETVPSMQQFLKEVQGQDAPDLSDLGIQLRAIQNSQSGKKSSKKMTGNLLADVLNQMDGKELREHGRKALQDKGLRDTLTDILKDAQRSARSDVTSKPQSNMIADIAKATGMEDTMLKALGGMKEELVDMAKEGKFKTQKSKGEPSNSSNGQSTSKTSSNHSDSNSSASSSPNTAQRESKNPSTFERFKKSASSAIKDFSKDSPDAPGAASADPFSVPSLGGGQMLGRILIILLITAVIAGCLVGSRMISVTKADSDPEKVLAELLRQGIRTREDVVKAFHQFALKPAHDTQQWWTHSRVVDAVVVQYPQHSTRIRLLSALYEQARYFPEDAEFTTAQIKQAADAVQTVGAA